MQACDIFAKIKERLLAGVMLHADMANYFDFLNLRGFEKMHEYHLFDEAAELRAIECCFVGHFNELIPYVEPEATTVIPETWYKYTRGDVSADTKRRAVRDGLAKWIDWETESKALYAEYYAQLCSIGEISAAMQIMNLICGVDEELKYAHSLVLTLEGLSYCMSDIVSMQDKLYEKFKGKMKKIWD